MKPVGLPVHLSLALRLLGAGLLALAPAFASAQATDAEMPPMQAMDMQGMLGAYPMMREASGTSWQPDSSPHGGVMGEVAGWQTMVHGFVDAVYDHQGGPRGAGKSFSASMLMLMAQRQLGAGTLGVRAMGSLDPLMGKAGYPELLQTGETADGVNPLIDRQHPHNLLMELAVSYSVPLAGRSSAFIYAGLPGEPALGPPAFMHRVSGMDNPEAPITHHWLDSTHITMGVVTLGYVRDRFKAEVSAFHGREPDQFRYRIEPGRLDSASIRLSYNPDDAWSLQVSQGYIKSPESLSPEVNVRRTTASASYNQSLAGGNWQTTFAWGRNRNDPGQKLDGYLLESSMTLHDRHTFFGRIERVSKDELFADGTPQAGQAFAVGKASAGYIFDQPLAHQLKIGVGGLVSVFTVPDALRDTYGAHPAAAMVFARIKFD
jgi:hypothetical protein